MCTAWPPRCTGPTPGSALAPAPGQHRFFSEGKYTSKRLPGVLPCSQGRGQSKGLGLTTSPNVTFRGGGSLASTGVHGLGRHKAAVPVPADDAGPHCLSAPQKVLG